MGPATTGVGVGYGRPASATAHSRLPGRCCSCWWLGGAEQVREGIGTLENERSARRNPTRAASLEHSLSQFADHLSAFSNARWNSPRYSLPSVPYREYEGSTEIPTTRPNAVVRTAMAGSGLPTWLVDCQSNNVVAAGLATVPPR